MIARALDAGVPAKWVAGDEVYGGNPTLRSDLEKRQVGYVLAVACDHHVATATYRADELVTRLPKRSWQRLSAGKGAKGHRFYDWAWIGLVGGVGEPVGYRWLLIRRNRRTGELAYYRCYAPTRVSLATLVRVAGRRWTVEESFQPAKARPVWTNTRAAPGRPGIAGQRSCYSRTPSSPPCRSLPDPNPLRRG